MKTTFRIEQLIRQYAPDKVEHRGLFRKIEEWSREQAAATGDHVILERHKMSRLFRNNAASISFDVLDKLCEYLSEKCHVPEEQLPQALFDAKEQNLLDLFKDTNRLQFSLGVRLATEWGHKPYVMATDAALQGEFTGLVTRHLAARRDKLFEGVDTMLIDAPPRHVTLTIESDKTTELEQWEKSRHTAARYFQQLKKSKDVSVVAIGSAKVSGVVEYVIASMFGAKPYEMQRVVRKAEDRKIPLFFRYRDDDPQPKSCFGGVQLSRDVVSEAPGVYYEEQDGSWSCLLCDDNE